VPRFELSLIRNAYQHTLRGRVVIEQAGSQVIIMNRDESCGDTQNQLGFGLGINGILRLKSLLMAATFESIFQPSNSMIPIAKSVC